MTTDPQDGRLHELEALDAILREEEAETPSIFLTSHDLPNTAEEALSVAKSRCEALSLPSDGLSVHHESDANFVVVAAAHEIILRKEGAVELRRDLSAVNRARRLGVTTPACLFAHEDWAIWERLDGSLLVADTPPSRRLLQPLFQDLRRIHLDPAPEGIEPISLAPWKTKIELIPGLDVSERLLLYRVSETGTHSRQTFIHASMGRNAILVSPSGGYAGIVDWSQAGWGPPEVDYAWLDASGLREAMDNPPEVLDWALVATLRVGRAIDQVLTDQHPLAELQEALGFWQLMN